MRPDIGLPRNAMWIGLHGVRAPEGGTATGFTVL